MGFFGVATASEAVDLRIVACHLNLWSLDALFGRRILTLDVGLRLRAITGAKPKTFTIVLPCDADPTSPEDLSSLLKDDQVRTIIFARSIPYADGVMTVHGEQVALMPLDTHATKLEHSGEAFSQWTIGLAEPLADTRDSYIRIRFRLVRCASLWEWRRTAFVKNRAVIDFRVADARGVTGVPNAETIVRKLVAVEKLNLFVIAPLWLRMRFASPDLEYARLFEGGVWERYLGRATGLWNPDKLVIYQWEKGDVGPQKPYRAFLELARDPELAPWGNHVRAGLVTLLLFIAASAAYEPLMRFAATLRVNLVAALASVIAVLTFPVLLRLLGFIKPLATSGKWLVQKFRDFETAVYRSRRR